MGQQGRTGWYEAVWRQNGAKWGDVGMLWGRMEAVCWQNSSKMGGRQNSGIIGEVCGRLGHDGAGLGQVGVPCGQNEGSMRTE